MFTIIPAKMNLYLVFHKHTFYKHLTPTFTAELRIKKEENIEDK